MPEFTCPKCGGHDYERECGSAGQPVAVVQCLSKDRPWPTCWRGDWPPPPDWHDRPTCPGIWLCCGPKSDEHGNWMLLTQEDLDRGAPFNTLRIYGPVPEDPKQRLREITPDQTTLQKLAKKYPPPPEWTEGPDEGPENPQ